MIKKDTYVQITRVILNPEDRSTNLPKDTAQVPLKMWLKGFLLDDGVIGEKVKIKTVTGRIEHGILLDSQPAFTHNFGEFVPELLVIDKIVKNALFGVSNDE